jgi:histidyl-tRNA synthetase
MGTLNTQLLSGFQYLYGQDLFLTKEVMRMCERTLERAQFEEILAPVVVAYSSIVGETDRPVAPAHADLVFRVQTDDGERLALSYENTLPACLFFVENFADSPPWASRRFYYISPHFRNERATRIDPAHRLRQFTQVGFEIIGGESGDTLPVAIETGSALLSDLGLNHSIRLSEVTLLSRILRRLGLEAAERSTLRDLFDRRDTLAFEAFLARSPLDAKQRALLARLFFSRRATPEELGELRAWLWENELEDALVRLECVDEVLSSLAPGIRRLASIDLSMVRTARLYTGIIYQYHFEGSEGSECGGGGEYNRVIEALGGPDTKACGAAFGLERIVHEYKSSTANNRVDAQAAIPGGAAGR